MAAGGATGPATNANSDRERNRKLHNDRYEGGQDRHWKAKLRHLTYRARVISHLSQAENQKQRREKKTRHKNDLIVDAVYHDATLASDYALFRINYAKSRGIERSQSR
jgi:hypothetical protein